MAESSTIHAVELDLKAVLIQFTRQLQKASNASKTQTGKVAKDITRITRSTEGATRALSGMKNMILQIGAIAGTSLSIYGAFSGLVDIIELAGRVEVLEVVTKNMGRTAGYTSGQIEAYVQNLKDLNITTQQANLSVTKFLQSGLPLEKVEEVARVARDVGVIMGHSTQDALKGLVHGIITLQPEVLRTYGIITNLMLAYARYAKQHGIAQDQIDQSLKQQIALNQVLQRGEAFVGTYETAMTKAFKRMLSLQRITEEFKVSMGRELQSVFSNFILTLSEFLEQGRKSELLKSIFAEIANALNILLNTVAGFVRIVSEHPNLFGTIFKASAITLFAAGVVSLSSVFSLLFAKITIISGAMAIIIMGASTLAVLFGKDLPKAMKIASIALGALIVMLTKYNIWIGTTAIAMGALVGKFFIVFGAISLLASLFNKLTDSTTRVNYEAEQLATAIFSTRLEANKLTADALLLIKKIDELGKKTKLTKDEQEELWIAYNKLVTLAPDYVSTTDDITVAMESAKKAAEGLNKELAQGLWIQNVEALNTALGKISKKRFKRENVSILTEEAREFADDLAESFEELVSGKGRSIAAIDAIETKYVRTMKLLRTTIQGLKLKDHLLTDETVAKVQETLQTIQGYKNQYSAVAGLARQILGYEETLLELENSKLDAATATKKAVGLSADQRKKQSAALANATIVLEGMKQKLESDSREKRIIGFQKESLQYQKTLANLRNSHAGDSKVYHEIAALSKNYVEDRTVELDAEIKLSDMRKAERNQRRFLSGKGIEGKTELLAWYDLQIASLDLMGKSGKELLEQFTAAREAVSDAKDLDSSRKAARDVAEDERSLRQATRARKNYVDDFLRSVKVVNLALQSVVGVYASFMNNILDIQQTGKERAEAIWQDMLQVFIGIVDQMIRRWVLFTLLTGFFRLPGDISAGALGISLPLTSGQSSVGGGGGGSVDLLSALNGLNQPGNINHELSITNDRLSSTVTSGDIKRRRSRL